MTPDIQHFFHAASGTLSYLVSDPVSGEAAAIDPVVGFSVVSGRLDLAPVNALAAAVRQQGLTLRWILETHAHADHLSGARYLQRETGGEIGIGAGIVEVQTHFAGVFNLGPGFASDGRQFDRLFDDGDTVPLGELEGRVMATPGHTNDSVTYLFGDAAFIGDSMFAPDIGTARCDFPGGDATKLYASIQKLLTLPQSTHFYLCHDYPPEGRGVRVDVPLAEQAAENRHIGGGRSQDDFVAMRRARDEQLSLPALILPAIQVNIRAGDLPEAEGNGVSYLKLPVDLF
ncbi:MAG: MBL fold metallo-hydrolase [Pseudomonadota bacterium]